MADGLNRVMLLGNLGADPELRMTQSGQAVLNIRLATAESYLDKGGERQERTEWHSVTVWGKRAEGLGKILRKGDRIFVEGSIRTSTYEKDGEKRYRTEINAREIILSGGGKRQENGEQPQRQSNGPRPLPKPGDGPREPIAYDDAFPPPGGADDDIPF